MKYKNMENLKCIVLGNYRWIIIFVVPAGIFFHLWSGIERLILIVKSLWISLAPTLTKHI